MNLSPTRVAPAHLARIVLATFALALLGSSAIPTYAADGLLRTVALTGQPAPGTAPPAVFSSFSNTPALSDLGQVAFLATLARIEPVTALNDIGVWSEGPGALALMAREGDQLPGLPAGATFGSTITSFAISPVLNDAGQIAFFTSLLGTGVTNDNNGAIWSDLAGPLEVAVREGMQAPGLPAGANFNSLGMVRLSDDHIAFTGRVQPGGNDSGVWRTNGKMLELIALEGAQAPGAPAGAVFFDFDGVTPALGAGGQVAFRARLQSGGDVTSANDAGIWADAGGLGLSLVAREGSPAPGTPAGVNFAEFGFSFNTPGVNALGHVAFHAMLQTGGGVTTANDTGIWSQRDGALALVAREGDAAPGALGVNFGQLLSFPPAINALGQTAFIGALQQGGSITFANDQGLWLHRDGQLELIIREGDQAPGAPPGATFNFGTRSSPAIVLNDEGRLAVFAGVQGSDPGPFGIWAEDLSGVLRLIVREGDMLEVAPGDVRTISRVFFRGGMGGDSGQGVGFNDAGEVAFRAIFTDGAHGVFVSRVAAIPEPGALALAVCGALAAVARSPWKSLRPATSRSHRRY
jgi:hypothetical protein